MRSESGERRRNVNGSLMSRTLSAPEEEMPSSIANKRHGTVAADQHKEMSGLEFVQGLVSGTLPLNTIAQTLGYDITKAESGAS
jgi:hypothetical protein